jgi:hypothetical protein
MHTHAVDRDMAAHTAGETEALAQRGFTREEMTALLRLQEWDQHGEVIAATSSALSSSSRCSSGMQAKSVRSFAQDTLVTGQGAEFPYFAPVAGGRDRFGNRLFTSPDLVYPNREGQLVQAALLVSPEGDQLIKRHPRILREINAALITLNHPTTFRIPYEMGQGRTIEWRTQGGQSLIYRMDLEEDSYILKRARPKERQAEYNPSQPYINEMLQCQAMAADLKQEFDRLGIHLATFLFASGHIACTKYEGKDWPRPEDFGTRGGAFSNVIRNYIQQQQEKGNTLWHNIKPDITGILGIKHVNFIQKTDDSIVMIDPFYYSVTGK